MNIELLKYVELTCHYLKRGKEIDFRTDCD